MLKNYVSTLLALITINLFNTPPSYAQTVNTKAFAEAVSGLELRGIGPALMGGRIADIAVSTTDRSTWYIAVGSGGL